MDLNCVHIIEPIHHCHLGATGTAVRYTAMYNFLFSSSPGLSPFSPAASGGSLARPFSRPPGLHQCVLAAVAYRPSSIIRAIRVLIMRGPPSGVIHQLVSSTVHMQMQTRVRVLCHACQRHVWADTAGRRHNDISSRDTHQWGVTVMAKSIPESCCSSP